MYGATCLVASRLRALLSGAIHNGLVNNHTPNSASTAKLRASSPWCHTMTMSTTISIIIAIVRTTAPVTMDQTLPMSDVHLNTVIGVCHRSGAGGRNVDALSFGLGRKEMNTNSLNAISNRANRMSPTTNKASATTAITYLTNQMVRRRSAPTAARPGPVVCTQGA